MLYDINFVTEYFTSPTIRHALDVQLTSHDSVSQEGMGVNILPTNITYYSHQKPSVVSLNSDFKYGFNIAVFLDFCPLFIVLK
jgi:hypothetical protein